MEWVDFMQDKFDFLQRISPVWLAFFVSLLLSLVAVLGVVTVGKDAAFYMDIARQVSESGVGAALERFNWPWFVLLLAAMHQFLGLPLEVAAYLLCSFFMAGTCALLVDVVRQKAPRAVWWAVLVVLAMPAFNQFRSDILREFGFWFFCVLALWLALRWQENLGWGSLSGVLLSIVVAALFRLEAIFLLPALALWQLSAFLDPQRRFGAFQVYLLLGGGSALGFLGLFAAVQFFGFPVGRVVYYLDLLNPQRLVEAFNVLADQFANSMTYKYSRDDAGTVVFFGFLAVLLVKFLGLLGPFAVVLFDRSNWVRFCDAFRVFPLFAWGALLYFLILFLFFINEQFINSRYLSFLNLLFVPFMALLVDHSAKCWPRLKHFFVAAACVVMIANVVSLGAKKTHYVEAGRWVAQNVSAQARVYYDDGRIAYYAGRGYPESPPLKSALDHPDQFDYLLIEADGDESWLVEWLDLHGLNILERFSNRKGDTVLLISR